MLTGITEIGCHMLHGIIAGIYAVTQGINGFYSRHCGAIGRSVVQVACTRRDSSLRFGIHQIDVSQTHVGYIRLELPIPLVILVTLVTLVRHQFLNEIARAASMVDVTHRTIREKVTILKFLLFRRQIIQTQHIVETIEHDVMIESGITVLIGMLRIPTGGRIQHIFTILYQIDGLTIGHAILIDKVGCRVVDDIVMLYETGYLRTKNLGAVPVSRVCTGMGTTEDSLGRTWHIPILLDRIEDVRKTG